MYRYISTYHECYGAGPVISIHFLLMEILGNPEKDCWAFFRYELHHRFLVVKFVVWGLPVESPPGFPCIFSSLGNPYHFFFLINRYVATDPHPQPLYAQISIFKL